MFSNLNDESKDPSVRKLPSGPMNINTQGKEVVTTQSEDINSINKSKEVLFIKSQRGLKADQIAYNTIQERKEKFI